MSDYKELIDELRHATSWTRSGVSIRAAEAIERLTTTPADKREDLHCVISDLCKQVRERDAELAALRAQLAQQEPVAEVWFHRGLPNFDDGDALKRLDDGKGTPIPLFLHPQADAKDAERIRALVPDEIPRRFNNGIVPFEYMDGWNDCRDVMLDNIDAAMKGGA